jgi:16S rRNA (cytosine1402-N4)-methyltransferase
MAKECIQLLDLKAGCIYVDATTGGGGHSLEMLKACPDIKLYCFDQDAAALAEAEKNFNATRMADNNTPHFAMPELIKANFSRLRTELAYRKIKGIDGILFDLGVSSHQLDNASRGFSFEKDAPLDMRMDTSSAYTAFNAVNELSSQELTRIFKDYSEELNAKRIANAIESSPKPISTTRELAKIIESVVGTGSKESLKSKVRIFQALRIHVNRELECLQDALQDAINLLNPGGRVVVLSYHSLEDRIVKQAFRIAAVGCVCPPAVFACVCNHKQQLQVLTKSPLTASDDELKNNNRARSAKLRAAEKMGKEAAASYSKRPKHQHGKMGEK